MPNDLYIFVELARTSIFVNEKCNARRLNLKIRYNFSRHPVIISGYDLQGLVTLRNVTQKRETYNIDQDKIFITSWMNKEAKNERFLKDDNNIIN